MQNTVVLEVVGAIKLTVLAPQMVQVLSLVQAVVQEGRVLTPQAQ
jgi:hypothetical protein